MDDLTPDDRVLPVTRRVAWLIVPFLAAAFVVLYGVPGETATYFAWTIRPEMTPVLMGAGYGAGVYFFYRVATTDAWHSVAPVFLGITAFTWLMGIATILHWENFNHGHVTFALWVVLYAVTPVLVPALWIRNRRTDPGPGSGTPIRLPPAVRLGGAALAVPLTVVSLALFAVPDPLVAAWPWSLSPLTARVLAGWFALFGVVTGAVVADPRWSGARIAIQSELLGFALVLLGVGRFWGNFDQSNPLTWAIVGGMATYLVAIAALYVTLERH